MIFSSSYQYKNPHPSVVALGCFDGVHRGHAAVISEAKRIAGEQNLCCIVWTFDMPPRNFFVKGSVPLLTDCAEKQEQINRLGADVLVSVPFDASVSSLSPEDFFTDILYRGLSARHIVCGFNFTFGKGGTGNTHTLRDLCREAGMGLSVLPPVCIDDEVVSSSRIRALIQEGDSESATRCLGRPYSFSAPVIHGQHLARKLGFPTFNQCLPEGFAIPRYGVYASYATLDGKTYPGITNVGIRPTVGGNQPCAETHLFGFSDNLYGKKMRVHFLHFLRPEICFSSVEALSAQVHQDIQSARLYFENSEL